MDEPFGSLDAQTRESLQGELIQLHQQTRKTVVFVTHDLDEAVLLADRVIVFAPHGRIHKIVEVGIPRPRNDVVGILGAREFHEQRYHIWKTLKSLDERTPEVAR